MKREEDISVAVLYPGNRAEKMTVPLEATDMDVAVEPDDAYDRDVVIADNADRHLATEVLKRPFHGAKLVYRMRGDVFHELDLWEMHWLKEWIARNVVLPNVDGTVAVSRRLAEKYADVTGNGTAGSAGLWKRVDEWPDAHHTDHEIRALTLTNANYWEKVREIPVWASAVDEYLKENGGWWRVAGDGTHDERLAAGLDAYDRVEFVGFVDAKTELARANVVLHPSRLDGQPNAVLEGMASGLPVLTTDFEAFTDFDGPLWTISDLGELVASLTMVEDPEHREMIGISGVKYMEAHHTPEAIGEQYVDYFRRLLS